MYGAKRKLLLGLGLVSVVALGTAASQGFSSSSAKTSPAVLNAKTSISTPHEICGKPGEGGETGAACASEAPSRVSLRATLSKAPSSSPERVNEQ